MYNVYILELMHYKFIFTEDDLCAVINPGKCSNDIVPYHY